MSETTKMTQKDMYNHIAEVMADEPMVVEFCEKKVKQIEARADKPRKPRINREAHEFAVEVAEFLKGKEPMTNKEITEALNEQREVAVKGQKVAAALRKLVNGEALIADGDDMVPYEVTVTRHEPEKASDSAKFSVA